jgi:uncharacterized membrane protein
MLRNKLIKLVLFCVGLVILRLIITQQLGFVFLCWNLFLAWLPYYFVKKFNLVEGTWKKISMILLCILFLPNAPYIVTDLFHLKKDLLAPLWLDTILILSFALAGLVFFILTIHELLLLVKRFKDTQRIHAACKIVLMLLSSYGVYLGRYLRFNSWDIISDPYSLAHGIFHSLAGRGHLQTFGVTLTLAAFLYFIYELYEMMIYHKTEQHEISDSADKSI